jgi:hypothetical protein
MKGGTFFSLVISLLDLVLLYILSRLDAFCSAFLPFSSLIISRVKNSYTTVHGKAGRKDVDHGSDRLWKLKDLAEVVTLNAVL